MALGVQRRRFNNSRGLNSPSTNQFKGVANTEYTFQLKGMSDGYPPRSIRCNADGTFEYKDWFDVTHTLTVKASETLPIMPKVVNSNTDIDWLGYY